MNNCSPMEVSQNERKRIQYKGLDQSPIVNEAFRNNLTKKVF